VGRGDVICNNLNYCQESSEFKANITILELPETKKLVSNGYECILHMHAIASQAQI
jgi:peptide chain release factor subunit 3